MLRSFAVCGHKAPLAQAFFGHPLLAALELYADQLTDLLEQRARVLETVEAFRG